MSDRFEGYATGLRLTHRALIRNLEIPSSTHSSAAT
jgi:hypothetical protein